MVERQHLFAFLNKYDILHNLNLSLGSGKTFVQYSIIKFVRQMVQ